MCLAIPAKILEIRDDQTARVAMGGVIKDIQVNLIDDLKVDDYVIIHAGFALARVDEEEALKTLDLMAEVGIVGEQGAL